MKVLVTGATGFLGSHVVDALRAMDHSVRALVRRTSRPGRLERLGAETVLGDMKDRPALQRAVEGMDAVIHAASTMAGQPEEYVAATVEGTRALLEVAEAAGVRRFVYVSSIGVHNTSMERTITEETPYETDPEALGPYTSSKIAAERLVLEFVQRGTMEVVVVRPGILYGPRGKWNISRLGYPLGANLFMTVGRGRVPLPVCYVRNCATAIRAALERPGLNGAVFNIVDDDAVSAREYLKRFRWNVRSKLRVIPVPYRFLLLVAWALRKINRWVPRFPRPIRRAYLESCHRQLRYSNERARRELGWRPEIRKEQALAETMAYFAEHERISRRADLRALRSRPISDDRLTVVLIGGGAIAESHLKFLDDMEHARVVAVCDQNIEAARALCDRYRIFYAYDDPAEMLKKERPDVVHILTPPQSHAALAELAISRGCHVLVEKPMAMNAEEARRMVDLARDRGVRLCVDHNHLYDPLMVRARRILESGRLGDLLWVESYYGFDLGNNPRSRYMLPGGQDHWTFQLPGGLYQNLAPHPFSLALEVIGKPTALRATARYGRVLPHQNTDELRVFLESERAAGLVTVSIAASPRFQYLNLYGTRGTLQVDILNKWMVFQGQHHGVPKPISRALMNLSHGWAVLWGTLAGTAKLLARRWTPYDGMELLIHEFYASLLEGREPPVSGEEALVVMDAMDETWRQIGMGTTPKGG